MFDTLLRFVGQVAHEMITIDMQLVPGTPDPQWSQLALTYRSATLTIDVKPKVVASYYRGYSWDATLNYNTVGFYHIARNAVTA